MSQAIRTCSSTSGFIHSSQITHRSSQPALVVLRLRCSAQSVFNMTRRNESEEERAARRAAVKAAKSEKRANCQGLGDPSKGRKPCTLCSCPRDLLIRCQVDETLTWHMACGKCWISASGGEVDGASDRPNYRYGGLWKNHHKSVSGRNKIPHAAIVRWTAGEEAAADGGPAGGKGGGRSKGGVVKYVKGEENVGADVRSNAVLLTEDSEVKMEEEAARAASASIPPASVRSTSSVRALLLTEAALCRAEYDAVGTTSKVSG